MSTVQLVVAGLLVAAFALFLWAIMSKPDIEEVPATARGALLESQQIDMLRTLEQAVEKRWLVWACVPLTLLAQGRGDKAPVLNRWLERRWVDYVILDPGNFQSLAALQVERKRSKGPVDWQPGRDPDLTRIMEQAGLPLLWLPSENYRDRELLSHALEQAIAGEKDHQLEPPLEN